MLGCTHAEGELLLQRITTSIVLEASSCYLHEEIILPLGRAAACSCLCTEQRLHPALSASLHNADQESQNVLQPYTASVRSWTSKLLHTWGQRLNFRTYRNNFNKLEKVKVHFPDKKKSQSSVFWQKDWVQEELRGGQVPGGADPRWSCWGFCGIPL